MKWPKIKIGKSKESNVKAAALGTSSELGAFLIFGTSGSGETASSAISLYEKSTAVSIPVNMIAEAFASIEPVIMTPDRTIKKHPILDLISNPSPFFTQDLFFEALAKNYLITGESFIVALGGITRPPLELNPISPKDISDVKGSNGYVQSFLVSGDNLNGDYRIKLGNRRARYFNGNLREMIQIRNFSTRNGSLCRGQSPLLAASSEARQHIKGNKHNISILDNGGRISLVFHFEDDLNNDEFQEVKERVDAQYGGTSNAGNIGVTAGPKMDIKEMGVNNKDMDFVNLQRTAKVAVAQQYQVPLPLVLIDRATFNNYSEARLALYDNAVLPVADRIFAGLTNLLMPRFGADPSKMWISYDVDKITALVKRRNEELKLRKEMNLESTNELRETLGKEPVEGGEQIMVPATLIPLNSSLMDDNEPDDSLARDNEDDDDNSSGQD